MEIIIQIETSNNNNNQIIPSKWIRMESKTISGYGAISVTVNKKSDYSFYDIADGRGKIVVLAEAFGENIPPEWVNHFNCRMVIPIDIRKNLPNKSPLYFEGIPDVNMFSQTVRELGAGGKYSDEIGSPGGAGNMWELE